MPAATLLRAQIEAALAHRIPSALTPAPRLIREVAPTGIRSVDELLNGGFPSGAITEIAGPECSGRTSLALSFIAGMTRAGKICAWVDVSDSLHPKSAAAAGVDLRRLLWVRCGVPRMAGTPQPESVNFSLPEKYFAPRPIQKGLHGGGFGPHPRGEVKGLSTAIAGFLRPDDSRHAEPRGAEPLRKIKPDKFSFEAASSESAFPRPLKKNTKAPFADRPWSRLDQALRVTDLLLQNGGLGAIVLDMGSIAPDCALRVPLATWFRYRAAAEQKQTSILLLMQHACAKSSAGLTLRLQSGAVLEEETTVFSGIESRMEVVRDRLPEIPAHVIPLRKPPQTQSACWQSRTAWISR
jgi:recombination protein RecA